MHHLPSLLRECADKLREIATALEKTPAIDNRDDSRVEKILEAVCEAWGVRLSELIGKGKSKRLAEARFAAIRMMQTRCPSLTLTETAQLLGRKDHGTVRNGRRQADCWLETDPGFRARYEVAAGVFFSKA